MHVGHNQLVGRSDKKVPHCSERMESVRYCVLQRIFHLIEGLRVAMRTEKWKAKSMHFWFDYLSTNCALKGVHRPVRSFAIARHADGSGRFVRPIFHHPVDAVWTDCVEEPLDVRSW